MSKFQISETVNMTPSIQSISNSIESPMLLSNSNIGMINSKINNSKYPQETPLSTRGNVKSYCRIRPNETMYSCTNRFTIENNNKSLTVDFTSEQDRNNPSKQMKYKYNFTEVFWTTVKNEDIYKKVCEQNVQELFSMHKNALIFVYGITNSGKTYTVNGYTNTPGILQMSLISLFEEYKKLKNNNNCWQLTCTYIEIYNEEVFDLLSKDKKKIKIVGSGNKFYPQGCIIKNIEILDDFTDALTIGENNRTKAETNVNPYSSRSHSIFRVELSYNDKDGFCFIEPVSLCIVDLAGAERVSKSGVIGTNLKEAGNINSSLLVLKKCFDAMEVNSHTNLVEKKVIVPVRESKLTMLFKEYFAAHQNISVICTINPDRNELMDTRSVLNFGAKAMRVKPVKSWIPTYNYGSKDINYNKSGSKGNSPFIHDNKKKYRLLTEKKYLEKKYNYNNSNHYLQNSSSKENISKVKEDNYSNASYEYSSNKKDITKSGEKMQNIKIINYKNNENSKSPNRILNLHNENKSSRNTPNKSNKKLYEERIKCYNNPYNLVASKVNNFFMKNYPSKEKLELEREMKERKEKEMKYRISKNKEDIKNLVNDIFSKKIYYKNLEQNIKIYENQCRNIDLNEVEALLNAKNANNFYSLKNPFAKNLEKNNFVSLSKTHAINLAYLNAIKEKILKNENNINISFKPSKRNQNLEIISNYNIGYIPDKNNNNEFDIFRGNRELIEELQLKLNNSEHDQAKIVEYLDKSFEQYNASQFKAYFGIGNSLVKKMNDEQQQNKEKEKEKEKENKNDSKNDIEMIDKIDKAENDENINFNVNDIVIDFLSNEYNFKRKGKDVQNNNEKREVIENKKEKENENEESNDDDNDKRKKSKKKKKKKEKENKKEKKQKKKRRNKKEYESDSDDEKEKEKESENESEEEEEIKEKESKKREEKEDEDNEKENSKEDDSEEEKEKEKKSLKRKNASKKKKRVKKSRSKKRKKSSYYEESDDEDEREHKDNNNNNEENNNNEDNNSTDEEKEKEKKVVNKRRKKRKNKKKKIESDIDSDEDLSEDNENIKPRRKRKKGTKKNKH